MKTLKLTSPWNGKTYDVTPRVSFYSQNDNLCVELLCRSEYGLEPYSRLTVNLGNKLPPDTAYIDSNNNGEAIMNWLIEKRLGKPTGNWGHSGFCSYPEFKFDIDRLYELAG